LFQDLVKGLTKYFEGPVTAIFTQFVNSTVSSAFPDESELCRAKDACMFLITAVAARGTTAASGATETNQLVNIVDFFRAQVLPELQAPLDQRPILKAAGLKFTATFRTQLSQQMSSDILGAAISLLKSENEVVHSYAANLIERMLAMKTATRTQV
jgi:exportin-2 (importin alpha re-exporter)